MISKKFKGAIGLLFFFLCVGGGGAAAAAPAPSSAPPVKGLSQPWAGGFNAVHFASLGSGYIAFDRVGNRVRYFDADWRWVPGAEAALPPLRSWVQTHDFNGDGLKDIFTFNGVSGITVYKNMGEGADAEFALYAEALMTEMFGQQVQLYCISEDYPVIEDIDGDGDLDVLNFWVPSSGDFLLFYKNYAREELGRTDTFVLRVEDWSWGCFVENEESNQILLDSCSWREPQGARASGPASPEPLRGSSLPSPKHSGSTVFAFKNKQTGLFDIVLGDVGYPNLYYLQNGGTPHKARIVKYDTFFPYTVPVHLHYFPVMSRVRVGDTLCYVYSPYQSNGFQTEGSQSVWRYADTGGGALYAPLVQKDFLQNRMIDVGSGAYPVAYDYNNDGLTDLVIGNYAGTDGAASLTLYENTGTLDAPEFTFVTDNYLDLRQRGYTGLFPAFGKDTALFGTGFSAPVLFDINRDGKDELITGNKKGRLQYNGCDSLGGVNVTDRNYSNFGYAKPCFWQSPEGGILLAVGNQNGEVYFYDSIENNLNGVFRFLGKAATSRGLINVGSHASPLLCDYNNDGWPELIIGNQCGGLEYFAGGEWTIAPAAADGAVPGGPESAAVQQPSLCPSANPSAAAQPPIRVYPNPTNGVVNITGQYSHLTVMDINGRIVKEVAGGVKALSLAHQPPGIYFFRFTTPTGPLTLKLIK